MDEIIFRPFFMYKKSAFTLVELIIVITILSILGMIAFLSFNWYSSSARDSTRLTDLDNITKALEVTLAKTYTLPKPSNAITLTVSGIPIWYQGYADKTILSNISMSDAKDPIDWVYYTYSIDINQNKYQILWYLENVDSITYNSIIDQAYAEPTTYANRFPITKGWKLWIILDSTTLIPAQSKIWAGNSFDTASGTTSSWFTAQFTNTEKLVSTGWITPLLAAMTVYQPKTLSQYDPSLVGYWDMETTINSGWVKVLKDLSQYSNNWILLWGTLAGWTDGKIGKAVSFDGTNDYISTGNGSSLNLTTAFTITSWIKPDTASLIHRPWFNKWGYLLTRITSNWQTSVYWYLQINAVTRETSAAFVVPQGTWNYLVERYNSVDHTLKFYLNGIEVYTNSSLPSPYVLDGNSAIPLQLGTDGSGYFSWSLDEVRVYNRALSYSEISTLYNASK